MQIAGNGTYVFTVRDRLGNETTKSISFEKLGSATATIASRESVEDVMETIEKKSKSSSKKKKSSSSVKALIIGSGTSAQAGEDDGTDRVITIKSDTSSSSTGTGEYEKMKTVFINPEENEDEEEDDEDEEDDGETEEYGFDQNGEAMFYELLPSVSQNFIEGSYKENLSSANERVVTAYNGNSSKKKDEMGVGSGRIIAMGIFIILFIFFVLIFILHKKGFIDLRNLFEKIKPEAEEEMDEETGEL